MCIAVLPVSMSVDHICDWYRWRVEEGVRPLGIRVTDSGEPPCDCWKHSLYSLEEQNMLLTADPSLLPDSDVARHPFPPQANGGKELNSPTQVHNNVPEDGLGFSLYFY